MENKISGILFLATPIGLQVLHIKLSLAFHTNNMTKKASCMGCYVTINESALNGLWAKGAKWLHLIVIRLLVYSSNFF